MRNHCHSLTNQWFIIKCIDQTIKYLCTVIPTLARYIQSNIIWSNISKFLVDWSFPTISLSSFTSWFLWRKVQRKSMRCKIWCIQTTDFALLCFAHTGCVGAWNPVCLYTFANCFLVKIHCNWDIFWHLRLRWFLRKTIDTTSFESLPESGVDWGFEKFASELLGSYSSLTNDHWPG